MDIYSEVPGTPYSDVWDTLTRSISDVTGLDRALITDTASFREELAVDSMDMVEVLATVEECLGVSLDDLEFRDIVTVGDACRIFTDKARLLSPLASGGAGHVDSAD